MSRGAEIRSRRGQVRTRTRTKPTIGYLGPRDPGPHGKTLEQPRNRWKQAPSPATSWSEQLFATFRRAAEKRRS